MTPKIIFRWCKLPPPPHTTSRILNFGSSRHNRADFLLFASGSAFFSTLQQNTQNEAFQPTYTVLLGNCVSLFPCTVSIFLVI